MRAVLRRYLARMADLWRRARREHSTPREVGWSVGVGVFSGCTPFVGFHMWIALGLATAFRLNRLWAFLGSRLPSSFFFAWIAFGEIELGHRARTGQWELLTPSQALAHGAQLLGDWLIGAAMGGSLLAAAVGLVAYAAARRWPPSPHTRAEAPPPSSGSPPSEHPAPTS